MNDRIELIGRMPRLERLRTAEEMNSVRAVAEANGHELIAPTHAVLKDNVIAGAFSIAGVPLVTMWLDTDRMKPRGSFSVMNTVEQITLAQWGCGAVLVERSSPFYPLMEAMGFKERGDVVLFTKGC